MPTGRSGLRNCGGFSLLEIAVMVVVLGLLVGGVLKGQEIINNVRVRNLIVQQESIRAAYFAFFDRYRSFPGDYGRATTDIAGTTQNGNGNDRITANGVAGASNDEFVLAWEHLSGAGFIRESYSYAASPETPASAPTNPYGRYVRIIFDNAYGTGIGLARHNVKTGNQIPSPLLAEVDLKIDDGVAVTGNFQFSSYNGGGGGGTAPIGAGVCYSAPPPFRWTSSTTESNCGGASLL